jgi:formylglycine-generating enzyme required for sulfatase activity
MKLEEVNEDLGQGISLEMVLIPAGKFMMGSPASEKGRYDFETQHEVTLTKSYYMGKYAVTQEQWEAVMGDNSSHTPVKQLLPRNVTLWDALFCGIRIYNEGVNLPLTHESWEGCQEFIKKLNKKTKGGYRLPTEAEWEYACRAGTTTAYSFGDSIRKIDANIPTYDDGIKAVGSYNPNAFGLYDMHGNVWEWCEDWCGDYPAGPVTDPRGPATGEYRVLRGGCFDIYGSTARSSYRFSLFPTNRDNGGLGFRLARTI